MSVRLMEGVIAAAMPTWAPGQFVQRPEDGSWFTVRASDLSNLKQLNNGTGVVASNSDPIGYWIDQLGSRILSHNNNSFRPHWNSVIECVQFNQSLNVNPKSLSCAIPTSQIASDSDITIMAVMRAVEALGPYRGCVGVSNFVAGNNYVAIASRYDNTTSRASLDSYSSNPNNHLSGAFSGTNFATFSITRSKVAGGKLQNFYINGALVNAGPSIGVGGTQTTGNIFYIFGPQYDGMNPTTTFEIKDLVIAYKKAQVTDHIGYYQYAVANGLI